MGKRLRIEALYPVLDGGEYPAKCVVGEHLPVSAVIWREGHETLAAHVTFTGPLGQDAERRELTVPLRLTDPGEDRWEATFVPDLTGLWTFRVTAWSAPWETWRHALRAKLDDGHGADQLGNELESGARLLERMSDGIREAERVGTLRRAAARLRDAALPLAERVAPALSPDVTQLARLHPLRELTTDSETYPVWVDRQRALTGAWYEFFPRSTGGRDAAGRPVHGTFATAAAELPRIARMGFDVVYLPPIHPIGEVHRKGANNALTAGPDDVGSPWAVGSSAGGHDAVHPALGTLADFDAFVAAARALDLEVALDLALQCAPDHPWLTEHPEWFTRRPDGSVAYAENPPKRYQDIHPLDFDADPAGLAAEVLRIVRFWADHGVRIFRVDNPHTKPAEFWHWLIWRVKASHPDVLFLAEAFTRPAVLKGLARLGFTQSYTYFTWRTGRDELADYARELADSAHFLRPNLFVNTPDILHASLQHGGPTTFAIRAALAATMSPTWGVYSGFELYEHRALRPGSEEYLDSEKYQLRPRDFEGELAAGRSLAPWITRLNEIRRARPALRQQRHLTVHPCDHEAVLAFTKADPATGERTLCVITLDPTAPVDVTVTLTPETLGRPAGTSVVAHDDITGADVTLGASTRLEIDPRVAVAHLLTWSAR
ncbi:alpha-1,4-glucan--maltose-1-phosphate maltosyltransferase [Streptomyces triticirhizae]|uniref:Alpha-1,4-glucan:maltose-1-phosphate maltosyltransferase n=1 Tax=Streptomyces triticirhizae TaxID=2483353 RepID=A0A3M2LQS0_9ACTN|nr:alpha-1,4-glucan--maltose-1-phosphate maltosyltransferase [Streptomyces triticirhizae]RMI37208.1 alpha-1,4-glucan--maltose-1-phosphate maltosyltransferase [Streptomyces triticirhizae]